MAYRRPISNKQHEKIIDFIHRKTKVHPAILTIIIKRFFWSLTDLLKKNKDVRLRGLFNFTMTRKVRESLKTPDQKVWTRKNDKRNYKKRKAKNKGKALKPIK